MPSSPAHPGSGSMPPANGGAVGVLIELGKFASLLLCILSLYALFHTIFFLPILDSEEHLLISLKMFVLTAAICWGSGWIFAEDERRAGVRSPSVAATLPMKAFWWVTLAIVVLYLLSWYLEEYYLPLRAQPLW
jgi:hypothetical protein